jgi:hypothetical protein
MDCVWIVYEYTMPPLSIYVPSAQVHTFSFGHVQYHVSQLGVNELGAYAQLVPSVSVGRPHGYVVHWCHRAWKLGVRWTLLFLFLVYEDGAPAVRVCLFCFCVRPRLVWADRPLISVVVFEYYIIMIITRVAGLHPGICRCPCLVFV